MLLLKKAIEMEKNWVCHIFIEDRVELPTMGWKWVRENGIPITLQKWIITDSGANSAAAQRQLGQILTQPKWAIRIVSSHCITRENPLQIYSKEKPAVTTHMPWCNPHLHSQTSSCWLWGIQELPGLEFVVFTFWMQEHHAGASRRSRTAPFPRLLMCVTRALRGCACQVPGWRFRQLRANRWCLKDHARSWLQGNATIKHNAKLGNRTGTKGVRRASSTWFPSSLCN